MTGTQFPEDGLLPAESFAGDWPAIADGRRRVPPPAHVLDHLVRQFVLVDELAEQFAPDAVEAGTVALLVEPELPACDLCTLESRRTVPARYDAPAGRKRGAPWGFLCGDCYVLGSTGILGVGRGQYLLTRAELNPDLEHPLERSRAYWRGKGANVPDHSPFREAD